MLFAGLNGEKSASKPGDGTNGIEIESPKLGQPSNVFGAVAGIGSQQQAIGTAGAGLAGSVGVDSSLQQQDVTFAVDSLDAKANVGSQQHQPIGNATERVAQYTRV